jgi:hypothetical protein
LKQTKKKKKEEKNQPQKNLSSSFCSLQFWQEDEKSKASKLHLGKEPQARLLFFFFFILTPASSLGDVWAGS